MCVRTEIKVEVPKGDKAKGPGSLSVCHSKGHQGPVGLRTKEELVQSAKCLINKREDQEMSS